MGRGSSTKKKGPSSSSSSSSKQNKPPGKGAPQDSLFSNIEGGNPFEPGTKNYERLMTRRRELRQSCTTTGSYVDEGHPFAPDNPRWREYLNAFATGKKLPSLFAKQESKIVTSPPKTDPEPRESKIAGPPDKYDDVTLTRRLKARKANRVGMLSVESDESLIFGPPFEDDCKAALAPAPHVSASDA